MPKKEYVGVNIQYPISKDIVSGIKTIETRTYPLPAKYLNQDVVLIETPGRSKEFKARATAIIKFVKCFKYQNESEFYKDVSRHGVQKGSSWEWKDKPKYGWEVIVVELLSPPVYITKKKGIRYTLGILI